MDAVFDVFVYEEGRAGADYDARAEGGGRDFPPITEWLARIRICDLV